MYNIENQFIFEKQELVLFYFILFFLIRNPTLIDSIFLFQSLALYL
jgi:hypothetical protein